MTAPYPPPPVRARSRFDMEKLASKPKIFPLWAILVLLGVILLSVGNFTNYSVASQATYCRWNAGSSSCNAQAVGNAANATVSAVFELALGGFVTGLGGVFFAIVVAARLDRLPKPEGAEPVAPAAPAPAPATPAWTPPSSSYPSPAPAAPAAPTTYPASSSPYAAPIASQPPAVPVAMPGAAPNCAKCGKPTTFVPQFSRYYCYGCAQYA